VISVLFEPKALEAGRLSWFSQLAEHRVIHREFWYSWLMDRTLYGPEQVWKQTSLQRRGEPRQQARRFHFTSYRQ